MDDPFPDHTDSDESWSLMQVSRGSVRRRERTRKNNWSWGRWLKYLFTIDREREEVHAGVRLDETLFTLIVRMIWEYDDDEEAGYYLIRPGAINSLNSWVSIMRLLFSLQQHWLCRLDMDNVDKFKLVKHRLYRQHTTPHEDMQCNTLHIII